MSELMEGASTTLAESTAFTLGNTSVVVSGEPSCEEWVEACAFIEQEANTLEVRRHSVMWWYGDLMAYGYAAYGEEASQAEPDGLTKESLRQAKYVSERIAPARRFDPDQLTWTHHQVVAPLAPDLQEKWLTWAMDCGATVAELKQATRGDRDVPWSRAREEARLRKYIDKCQETWPLKELSEVVSEIADELKEVVE